MEAVLPVETEIRSLRIALKAQLPEIDWVKDRLEQLSIMDEKRLRALESLQMYQQRLARTYDSRVRENSQLIKEGA